MDRLEANHARSSSFGSIFTAPSSSLKHGGLCEGEVVEHGGLCEGMMERANELL